MVSALAVLVQLAYEKLLALDQSSRITGWAIFDQGKLIQFGHFCCEQPETADRLVDIRRRILNLIQDNEIEEVVFEDIQLQTTVGNNVKTYKALAEVYGIVEELCKEINIPAQSIFSSSWKSGLNIKGKSRPEQKKNAQIFIKNAYNIECTQDEADAICIGTHYLNQKNLTFDWS